MSRNVFALQRAIYRINYAFGKESIMRFGRSSTQNNIHVMSTRSFAVKPGMGVLPKDFKQGIPGISQKLSFSTTVEGKSDGSDSDEENLSEKDLALREAMGEIISKYGWDSIDWLEHSDSPKNIPVVPTGSIALDIALGVGGLPKGRVVEIFGEHACGKTTLALHVIAEAQKLGGYCAFVDAEHALDKGLAKSIGVNTKKLLVSQPKSGEQALTLVDILIRSGSVNVIVVDSVAALVPQEELDGELGDFDKGKQAKLMSKALRKLSHSLSVSQCVLIFLNQVRLNLEGIPGLNEVTCGGDALKCYASIRLKMEITGYMMEGRQAIGNHVQVEVMKNKVAPPYKTAKFELEFGKGINKDVELVALSLRNNLISFDGSFYEYNGHKFHFRRDAFKKFLAQDDVGQELTKKLREKLFSSETEKVLESKVLTADVTEE